MFPDQFQKQEAAPTAWRAFSTQRLAILFVKVPLWMIVVQRVTAACGCMFRPTGINDFALTVTHSNVQLGQDRRFEEST